MTAASRGPVGALLLALVALLALPTCDAGTPESRLKAAAEDLEDAREDASDAQAELEQALADLRRVEDELDAARRRVRSAQKEVLSREVRVRQRATDAALFRAVQGRLLESDVLRQEAVGVRVEDGVVSLEGVVGSRGAQQAALQVARAVPGVGDVRDRLAIVDEGDASL